MWGGNSQEGGSLGQVSHPPNGAKSAHPYPGWGRMVGLPFQFVDGEGETVGHTFLVLAKEGSPAQAPAS